MVRAARAAGGPGGGEGQPLAALTLDLNMLWAPSVDLAHLDLLHIVARFGVLALRQRLPSSFSEPVPQKEVVLSLTRGWQELPSMGLQTKEPKPRRAPALTIYGVTTWLGRGDVVRLHALLTAGRLEGDLGPLVEGLEPLARYPAVMDEEVVATLVRGDKAVALIVVEPLNRSLGHMLEPAFLSWGSTAIKKPPHLSGGASLTIKPI